MVTSNIKANIESAISGGQWDVVYDEASPWSELVDCGPVPFFAVNVVCLLRGDFAQAWRVYPQALGEETDVQCVREWVGFLREQYPDSPHVALFEGIFHTQSGRLEDAFACFERVMAEVPQSPYPHFFLAQIHQRQGRVDQSVKAFREAIKRDPSYVAARLKLGVVYQDQVPRTW